MRLPFRKRKGRRRERVSKARAGTIAIALIGLIFWGAFTKFANPFASPYTIRATFPDANGLKVDSLVRIAGVNVGKVTRVSFPRGCSKSDLSACNAAVVTMQITPRRPIHEDATFEIRPRIFLEGNFFIQLSPGTPSSPLAPSGYTFPIQQGFDPVQFDQILDALPRATRANLQLLLAQYGKGIYESSSAFNDSIQYWTPAYRDSSIVAHDLLGLRANDLPDYIRAQGEVSGALAVHQLALENMITHFNITAQAFARENAALAAAVAELPRTLSVATPAFHAVNAALPPLDRLAVALLPGVRTSGRTITVSLPFIHQLRLLVEPSELRGLAHDLSGTVPALARLTLQTIPLLRDGVRPLASCVANVIYPWSRLKITDVFTQQGMPVRPVYVEAVDYLPGLAGESRDFDANGPYIRVLGTGGTLTYSLSPGMFGQALAPIDSVQPQPPPGDKRPPLRENVPCETQPPITSLYAPPGGPINQTPTAPPTAAEQQLFKLEASAALQQIDRIAKQDGMIVHLTRAVQEALR